MNIQSIVNNTKHFIHKNSSEILTGFAIIGVIGVTASAIHDTRIATRRLNVEEIQKGSKLTKTETIRVAAPCYIPTGLSVVATLVSIVGAHNSGNAKTAAYATAYTMAQEAAKNYREQVSKIVSDKDLKKIDEAVADSAIKKSTSQPIVVGNGKVLCFDQFSGRYFESDMQSLREIQNDMNEQLFNEMWVPVNAFYYKIGLEPINAGEELGWRIDDQKVKLGFSSRLSEDGRPCLVVSFTTSPSADYYRKY